jgi:hypothetical protein
MNLTIRATLRRPMRRRTVAFTAGACLALTFLPLATLSPAGASSSAPKLANAESAAKSLINGFNGASSSPSQQWNYQFDHDLPGLYNKSSYLTCAALKTNQYTQTAVVVWSTFSKLPATTVTDYAGGPAAASSGVKVKYRYGAVTHFYPSSGSSYTAEAHFDYFDGKLDWGWVPGGCKASSTPTPSTPKTLKIVDKVNGNSYLETASYNSGAVTKAGLIVSAVAGKKIEVTWDANCTLKNGSNGEEKKTLYFTTPVALTYLPVPTSASSCDLSAVVSTVNVSNLQMTVSLEAN